MLSNGVTYVGASSEDFDEGEVQVKVEEEDEGTMMALTLSAM